MKRKFISKPIKASSSSGGNLKELIDQVKTIADGEFELFVVDKKEGNNIKFTAYLSKSAFKQNPDVFVSRLTLDPDQYGISEEELSDPDYLENSAYAIAEDLSTNNSGDVEEGEDF